MINKITSFIFLLYVCVLLSVGGFYCRWIQDCLNSVLLVDVNCSGVIMQLVSNLCISWICCTAFHNTKCSVHNTLTVKDRSIAVTLYVYTLQHTIYIVYMVRALIRVVVFLVDCTEGCCIYIDAPRGSARGDFTVNTCHVSFFLSEFLLHIAAFSTHGVLL